MRNHKGYTGKSFNIIALALAAIVVSAALGGIAGCGGSDSIAVNSAPTVISTNPLDVATDVAINQEVAAAFSEAMDPATITTTSFTLMQGATAVSGTVAYTVVGNIATFTPDSALTASTLYTATITTGAADLAGKVLASSYIWTFTTGTTSDTTVPALGSTNPGDTTTDVALNMRTAVTFNEPMDPLTITNETFTLAQGETSVEGTVSYVGLVATFNPTSSLAAGTTYTASLSTGVKDLAGNALAAAYTWTFTTGTVADTTAPTVDSTDPADVATDVVLNRNAVATFSKAMDPLTITTATFTLMQGTIPVAGAVTSVGSVATFNPTNDLAASTTYTATITAGVKDLPGNALAANKVWTFTTGTVLAAGPSPVNLGTAGNFVILTKTGISTVPNSAITGNIGVSPAATSFLTGFSLTMVGTTSATSTQVTGNLYGADMTAPTSTSLTTAVSDMQTAFVDAAGRAIPDFTELGAGDITTLTLVPGLYKWGTGVLISAGGVTLNGGPNDVWIFQIAQDLTVANGAIITLTGGALPKNIFWQVSGQATLGTTANFSGIILSQTLISLDTGATLTGRALAQTAVTLDQGTVTNP